MSLDCNYGTYFEPPTQQNFDVELSDDEILLLMIEEEICRENAELEHIKETDEFLREFEGDDDV